MQSSGYAAHDPKTPLAPFTFERRDPGPHDVVIDIKYCGICHSDIHQARNEWSNTIYPVVPGHEITGIVRSTGKEVSKFRIGDTVGVGCLVDSCRTCVQCQNHHENYCLNGWVGTYNGIGKDGLTTMGGYSNNIIVTEDFVFSIPGNLSLQGAAPLLCAGITLYSPLKHWGAGPDKKVGIVGLGGLGHMGVKLASAMGAEVTVFSQSLKKKEDGMRLGATHFHATSDPKTFTSLAGNFDLIINTVSANIDLNQFLGLLKVDSTLVLLGAPEQPSPLAAFPLIMGRKSVSGSLIGGIRETQEMLNFCGQHNVTSDIELISINQVNEAYERVLKSDVRYRFVIDMATLPQNG